jgi:hypothetical protein
VSWNYCILRVSSDHERKAWMDAINAQIEAAKSSESEIHGESEQKMHRYILKTLYFHLSDFTF